MPGIATLLATFSWQELRHHPWRYAAALLSMALGVALAFSVHLINASALQEFSRSVQAVQGQPDLSVSSGSGLFDEAVFERVAAMPAVELASPVIEISTYALDAQGKKKSLKVLGVDSFVAAQLAPELWMQPKKAASSEGSDRLAMFGKGQAFVNAAAQALLQNGTLQVVAQGAFIQLQHAGSVSASGAALVVMDIGAMQDAFGLQGKISRIDLRLAAGQSVQAQDLPAGLTLTTPAQKAGQSEQLSRAYRVNMTVLALVALFTGAFLVYSVLTLAVAKRAQQLALLGVLGLSSGQRLRLVLLESSVLGLLGAVLGIALGTGLAFLGLKALGGDLGGGYFGGQAPALRWSLGAALVYGLLGWLAALAGAWWPARGAQALPLAQTLKGLGSTLSAHKRPQFALFLVALGIVFSTAPAVFGIPIAAYAAVGLLLVGGMGLLPFAVGQLYDTLSPWVARQVLPMLAVQRARRMREVAVVAVSGVVAALSLGVALTVMVSSFRGSVMHWLDAMLPAPLYARLSANADSTLSFSEAQLQAFRQLPGVSEVRGLRLKTLAHTADQPPIALIATDMTDLAELPTVAKLDAPPAQFKNAMPAYIPVYVSEAMVDVHSAVLGQVIKLNLEPKMPHAVDSINKFATNTIANSISTPQFYVAGIWRDYVRQFGSVVMRRSDYVQLTGDSTVSDVSLWLSAGASEKEVQLRLRDTLRTSSPALAELVEFGSSAEIRSLSLQAFDRSFAVTYWLQAVAIGIGLFGIATSFSAQVLARRKEFGLLAHLGLTRREVLRLVALEGACWTFIGAVAGCVLGLVVSLILIHVVNPQSFHWTMDMNVPWLRLLLLCAAVMLAGTLTAWLSGRAAASQDAVLAVKEDW
jgi:putative ABC transport system permease protein